MSSTPTRRKPFQMKSEDEIFVQTFDYGAWRIISKGPLEIPNEEERWDENDNQGSIQFQSYVHTPLCYELLETIDFWKLLGIFLISKGGDLVIKIMVLYSTPLDLYNGGYHMSFTEGYNRVPPSYHKSKFINVHYSDCVGKYIPHVILIDFDPGGSLDNFLLGQYNATNKWATGHYPEAAKSIDLVLDVVHGEVTMIVASLSMADAEAFFNESYDSYFVPLEMTYFPHLTGDISTMTSLMFQA
ncbi:hypothetical protein Gotri_001976 [Gossypium trilobum]|uniref:Uncharacterized protein n=1 Tax=Gossypium trilobum TaxID=34281 RepID=A0A7J9F7U3_9ROSI|nr:hypothetical protein [Gossypium trilobum]